MHLQRNSAEVITGTTTQINVTVVALRSLLQFINASVVSVSLLVGLLLIDAPVWLWLVLHFWQRIRIISYHRERELNRNSHRIAKATTLQLKSLQEGLGAIRDVLLDGNQLTYLQIYRNADRPQRQLQAKNVFRCFPPLRLDLGHGGDCFTRSHACASGWRRHWRDSPAWCLGLRRTTPFACPAANVWRLGVVKAAMPRSSLCWILDQPLPLEVHVVNPLLLKKVISMQQIHFNYGPNHTDVLRGST